MSHTLPLHTVLARRNIHTGNSVVSAFFNFFFWVAVVTTLLPMFTVAAMATVPTVVAKIMVVIIMIMVMVVMIMVVVVIVIIVVIMVIIVIMIVVVIVVVVIILIMIVVVIVIVMDVGTAVIPLAETAMASPMPMFFHTLLHAQTNSTDYIYQVRRQSSWMKSSKTYEKN